MTSTAAYHEFSLGPEGRTFIRRLLSAGSTLARGLMQDVDLDAGNASTFLPEPLANVSQARLRMGGVVALPASEEVIERAIRALLANSEDVMIGEDSLRRASDPLVTRRSDGVVLYLDEVYHLGTKDGVGDLSILGAMRRTRSASGNEIFAITRWEGPLPISWPVRINDLSAMSKKARAIVVAAFDGEGYLIWRRDP